MNRMLNRKLSQSLRGVAAAMVAGASANASLAHAWPADKPIVVQPGALPEPARQPGQSMFLRNADDGRTLLYVEQGEGARLAIFDVSNPARIRTAGIVQLDAPGPFDFVSPWGKQGELLRYRQGREEVVLDLKQARVPVLKTARLLTLNGTTAPLVAQYTAATQVNAGVPPAPDHLLAVSETPDDYDALVDTKLIREEVTNRDTGTTFLLSDRGLTVIRRPMAERDKERREEERLLMYSGGG